MILNNVMFKHHISNNNNVSNIPHATPRAHIASAQQTNDRKL